VKPTRSVPRYWAFGCNSASMAMRSSFKYNQQDASLYNILYYGQCSTCFGPFLRPLSGAQELYTQHLVRARLAAATASWHVPDAMFTVLALLILGAETARNM
jgi:hypothetical protein